MSDPKDKSPAQPSWIYWAAPIGLVVLIVLGMGLSQIVPTGSAGYVIGAIVLGVLAFLLLRAFVCWYLKINQRINLSEETNHLLAEMLARLPEKPSA